MKITETFLNQLILAWLLRCLSVRPFVCPCVRTLSTPSFFVQFNQQGYCQKLHAKEKVLRSFPAIIIKKLKEKFNDSIFWKSYLYYENRSGSVHLFVCPFVCNATSFSILDRMGQQIYLWNPHVKSQVLRHFWSHSEEKQKSLPFCPHHLSIYLYYENSSGSVRLFVRPYVRTSSTFLVLIRLAQQRYLWIPYKKGQVLRHCWSNSEGRQDFFSFRPNHLSIYIMKAGVCLSVCV